MTLKSVCHSSHEFYSAAQLLQAHSEGAVTQQAVKSACQYKPRQSQCLYYYKQATCS